MKNCLLFLAVVAALAIGSPAYSQFMYLDINGDGLNSHTNSSLPADVLTSSVTSVDVYLDTNHDKTGGASVCPTGEPLSMQSYEFVLHAFGSGTVTYGTWTDNLGFTIPLGSAAAGSDFWIGKGGASALPANKYKLGTLAITVSGAPVLDIIANNFSLNSNAETAFGSNCPGATFDNTLRLGPAGVPGTDWTDEYGTEASTPVTPTTWGKIKKLYQ